MTKANSFVCTTCGNSYPLETQDWRCSCGGLFDLKTQPAFDASQIDATQSGLWRYRAMLPLEDAWEPVTLGEGYTPLVSAEWDGQQIDFKMESQAPTGSFKDRGSTVLATALRGLGIQRVVEDSSGNAGASLSAYAARAGIACELCVPSTASGPKLAQMAAHGAEVVEIKGKRAYAALAAWAAAAHGAHYASHVYNPYFLAGTETMAFELWEQLSQRAPAALIVPVGNGTLLLGAYHGFRKLLKAGLIARLPRLFAVQATGCAPIYQAFVDGRMTIEAVATEATVAGGIAIGQPARGAQVLEAVRASDGAVVSVTEEEIAQAHSRLRLCGFYVEHTSAAAAAALGPLRDTLQGSREEPVVVPLTGHGLKNHGER
jgi:threonine synthase